MHQERIAREIVTTVSLRADKSLAKVLADAWQAVDCEKEAHRHTTEEVAAAMKDCEFYRHLFETSERQRTQEALLAQEAMRAVQRAQTHLTQVKEENEVMLDQVIRAKMDFANKCMEYDDLDKNYNELQRLYLASLTRDEWLENNFNQR